METKYSTASARAIDYVMMMKGEHGLLEYLSESRLDCNFCVHVDGGMQYASCTWWRPGDPGDQPLLKVQVEVGSDLDGVPVTALMISEQNEEYANAIWSRVPPPSFLRRGIVVESIVSKFVEDKADTLLEQNLCKKRITC